MSEDDVVKKRKDKIKDWFKDPLNIVLVLILVFSLTIRLYYFILTKTQPLWWDEAEYLLKAKSLAFGTPDTGWAAAIRPLLFPILAAFIFKIGLTEISLRFLWAVLSTINIWLLYLIGKTMFNKKVGLIAAFLLSVFYLDLFYTTRMLVDMPQIFFILLGTLFFVKYYFSNGSKNLILFVLPILFLGALMRFTVGIFVMALLIFLLSTERLALFKEKKWYLSAIL